MPIVKMDRLTLVGLAREREAVIEALMRLGAVQVDENDETAAGKVSFQEPAGTPDPAGTDYASADLPRLMSRLKQAITQCNKISPEKKPLFTSRRLVSEDRFAAAVEKQPATVADLVRFEEAGRHISEFESQIVHLQSTAALLAPWEEINIDLALKRTQKTRSFLGSFRNRTDFESFEQTLQEEAPESVTQVLAEDAGGLRVHAVTLRTRESLVLNALRRFNFNFLPIQDEPCTPAVLLKRIRADLDELGSRRAADHETMLQIAGRVAEFEMLHDHLQMLHGKLDLISRLNGTERTFYFEGWMPANLTESISQALADRFSIAFSHRPALPGESFPILLKNNKLIKPYEVVVEMFNPPLPTEVDPTPMIAPFYFLFFGMMLSDVGYGLLLSGLCAVPLFLFKVRGKSRNTYMLFFQCGLSAIFWGVMFGGYFGDLITAVTSGRVVIPPGLFDPIKNPTSLMLISVVFGLIHLFTGMAIKAYILFRCGDWRAAVFDVFPWYFLILGMILTLAGVAAPYTTYMALAGAAVIVLFSARDKRNPLVRVGMGLYTLYGITGYLGDILSYTRVLALVLATSVIAMVVNKIGMIFGPTVLGFIVFAIVAIVGHAVNFALSALSAYIHTSRLHFVEFFGKFYEGGGRLFKPQKMTARYIEIERQAQPAVDR